VVTSAPLPDRRPERDDEAASRIAALFERHGRMVYGICRAMLRDVHEAEDASQQVFLSAHRALRAGARVREAGAWLATIARNECRGRIAAGMRTPLSCAEEDLEAIPAPGDEVERRVHAEALRSALAELPERQREAVVLRYLYGLRYGEVATALGLSRPATEALLFRARRAMRVRLRPVVGAALVVPLALREELAAAIPGFTTGAGASAAAAGAAGGLLAKLTAGSVGAKVAATAVAVSTVGTVGAVESDRPERSSSTRAPMVQAVDAESSSRDDRRSSSGPQAEDERRSPSSGHDAGDDSATRGPGSAEDSPEADGSDSSGPGPGDEREIDESSVTEDSSGSSSGGSDGGDSDGGSSGSSGSSGSGSGSDRSGHGDGL
jgi:RNA polymerase sigma-70 factor (ECF subfamily)